MAFSIALLVYVIFTVAAVYGLAMTALKTPLPQKWVWVVGFGILTANAVSILICIMRSISFISKSHDSCNSSSSPSSSYLLPHIVVIITSSVTHSINTAACSRPSCLCSTPSWCVLLLIIMMMLLRLIDSLPE
jgi:hypothetical protein